LESTERFPQEFLSFPHDDRLPHSPFRLFQPPTAARFPQDPERIIPQKQDIVHICCIINETDTTTDNNVCVRFPMNHDDESACIWLGVCVHAE
jgi:hypothetical protein